MERQLKGIAIILLSILFAYCFQHEGWYFISETLLLSWREFFMLTGLIGAVITFLPDKKK